MRTLLALIAFALVWALPASPLGSDSPGVVEGRVINRSQGGGPAADLPVTLIIGSEPAQELSTRTNPVGQFRFEGLSTSADDIYTVAVRYQGVAYTAGGIQLNPDSPSAQVEVYVYEATTSTQAVRVLLDHHIAQAKPEEHRLEVVNYMKLTNTSDRTVVAGQAGAGAGEATLFPLPEAAENVRLLGVSSLNEATNGSGLTLNQAIPPGQHELLFTFELAYAGDSFVFRKPLGYPTDRAVFLMSAQDAKAESRQLVAMEVDSAAGPYQLLTGEELPAGTVLEVTLTGLAAGGGTSLGAVLRPAAAILAILVLGSIVAYARFRRRRASTSPSES